MIILNRPQTDPFFNLAAEEFLIKNTTEPLFMLWQNTPSVVVGKHQNALKEINLKFLQEKNIPVIRRISGGGTVFHDLGNLNYSFINFGHRESLVNFKKYSQPIVDVLQKMGVDAQLIGKSDLKIKGLKFSGNASHVYKNKVLHHGTLLFSSELNILNNSIKVSEINFSDKAVQSNRSTVTNIQSHLKETLSLEEFKQKIIDFVMTSFPET
ncbi:MAG: lipoate--protein ligase family protein, partial [Bacteroidales bacterium]|nr:lipoate--protein ligase family protein [Bacteroidales bacterium]